MSPCPYCGETHSQPPSSSRDAVFCKLDDGRVVFSYHDFIYVA